MTNIPVNSNAVSVVLMRRRDAGPQVLMLRRAVSLVGSWCHVAGGVEAGEAAWQAALREVREETGLELDELWSADICEQFYYVESDAIMVIPVFVGFGGEDAEVRLNDEHDTYRWVTIEEALDMYSYPGQRWMLRTVREEFIERQPTGLLRIAI